MVGGWELVLGAFCVVASGCWLVGGGWWFVAGGWWLVRASYFSRLPTSCLCLLRTSHVLMLLVPYFYELLTSYFLLISFLASRSYEAKRLRG